RASRLFPYTTLFRSFVSEELDTARGEGIDHLPDVVDGEVQDRVCRRHVVRLGIDEDVFSAPDVQGEQPIPLRNRQPQCVAVEPRSEEHTSELQSREN